MNTIDCIEVFIEVAKGLSFSKAAERLGTSRSVVTKKVAWLEKNFDTQLLQRNTKRVNLTESGEILLYNSETLFKTIHKLKDLVRSPAQHPVGRLRVGAPPSFGAIHLTPAVQAFVDQYPQVEISLQLDDGRADLITENLDLSVKIAPRLRDSNQIAYLIAVVPQILVATTTYLNKSGWPAVPADLERHNCLTHCLKAPTNQWKLTGPDGNIHNIRVVGTINSNHGESLLHLARRHHGISMHPCYMADEYVHEDELSIVLPDYHCEDLDIYAVIQSNRYLPYKIRLFVKHLRAWFHDIDWARQAGNGTLI